MSLRDVGWKERGACRGQDPRPFDPVDVWTNKTVRAYEATARKFCGNCPVIVQCAAYADTTRPAPLGLWGGSYRSRVPSRCRTLIPSAPTPGGSLVPAAPPVPVPDAQWWRDEGCPQTAALIEQQGA